ncbi:hypothetical protein PI125_g24900 [Phytophthora idaei]|nr:hypothetical protein PI125_g24900 [Phytophthora idaei]
MTTTSNADLVAMIERQQQQQKREMALQVEQATPSVNDVELV